MKRMFFLCIGLSVAFISLSQSSVLNSNKTDEVQRPKLVVGIVVDQMRWDYLYRYYSLYKPEGGFKKLLGEGFSCDNTFIPYAPALTACGHASIYTGSVPAINGITGNDWWDYDLSQMIYCTQDDNTHTIGSNTDAGKMSPRRLLTTTIGDELHLATNFQNKVIGIALKDRSAILPAGHSANAAYWYDEKTGDWISSSYYMSDLPGWVKDLNAKKLVDKYYAQGWNTLYPEKMYSQSTLGEVTYGYRPFGAGTKKPPYDLSKFAGKNYGILPVTPYGNSFTFEMARAAISGEQLGTDSSTDLLAISVSSPDYIGHTFGPNSIEAEDDFLRLDIELGEFLKFLDKEVGKDEYLIFLSADHGVANVPAFLKSKKIPAGNIEEKSLTNDLNNLLKEKFKNDKLLIGIFNGQVYLDRSAISSAQLNRQQVNDTVIDFLLHQLGITRAFALDALSNITLNTSIKNILANGYYPSRSGDIQIIFDPQWIQGFELGGTTHGSWNPYDTHIPLIWYGWNMPAGKTNRRVSMTDIAPTLAAILHIQMPGGSVGNVIEEVVK